MNLNLKCLYHGRLFLSHEYDYIKGEKVKLFTYLINFIDYCGWDTHNNIPNL